MTKEEIMEIGFFNEHRIFSNFHLKPIEILGLVFPSNENAFMAHKDLTRADEFVNITPMEARKLGRQVTLRHDWEDVKLDVMMDVNLRKFQSGYEHYVLVSTGQKTLTEFNWWHDNYWGDCLCPKCEGIEGLNMLGNILMQVRREV